MREGRNQKNDNKKLLKRLSNSRNYFKGKWLYLLTV